MLVFVLTAYIIGYIFFVYGALRASRKIHRDLVMTVLGTTLRYVVADGDIPSSVNIL